MKIHLLACLLTSLLASSSVSQVIPSGSYSTKDGLPSNTILSLYQDPGGYLWIGTNNGLCRYDGAQFTTFSTVQGLSNNWITDIAGNRKEPGTLWIGTIAGGVNRIRDGVVSVFLPGGDDASNNISSVAVDTSGTVWATTYFGLFMIRDGRMERITQTGIPHAEHLLALDDGTVWLAGDDKLFFHRPNDSLWIPVTLPAALDGAITEIARCNAGGMWIGSSNGCIVRLMGTTVIGEPLTCNGSPQRIVDDGHGTLWITTRSGLSALHLSSPRDARPILPGTHDHVPHDVIAPLILDTESNVWLGTWTKGVVKLAERTLTVMPHQVTTSDLNRVSAVSDSSGRIWISGKGGITEFYPDRNGAWQEEFHRLDGVRGDEDCYTSLVDHAARIWCVTGETREIRGFAISGRAGRPAVLHATNVLRGGKAFPEGILLTVYVDRLDRMFISIGKVGVAIVDVVSGRPLGTMTPADSIPGVDVRCVLQDHQGNLWMGGWNDGISVFTTGTPHPKFLRAYRTADGLPDNSIRALHEDRNGVMWVGTRHGGVARLLGGSFHSTSMANGLLSNSIWGIQEDGADRLYLLTDAGIERVSRKDALPLFQRSELRFLQAGSMGVTGGRYLWHVSPTEVVLFDHMRAVSRQPEPAVHFVSCTVNGKELPIEQGAEFHYAQNTFAIEYVAISFREERAVRYQYRLIGADTAWSSLVGHRSVTYAQLPPGSYSFQVRATIGDDTVQGPVSSYAFTIVPPVWQRWWFIACGGTGAAFILVLILRSRLRRILELERLRVRIASDLHDDVGTNLSSIMLTAQIMERSSGLTGAHVTDVRRLRSTAERTQEMLRDIVWFLDPGNDSGEDFILKLKELAGRILQEVPFQFVTAGKDAPDHLSLAMKRNIVLMVKESLTNVVKHAHAASVVIEAASGHRVFVLSIRDDGAGFDPSAEFSGNGIANLRRRARDIGGTLELNSAPGQGTQIRLTVNTTHIRSSKSPLKALRW